MTDLDYAVVTGRFALTVADGIDADDNPDTVWCVEGRVVITPLNTFVKVLSGDPSPFTMSGAPIEATIDSEGYLTYRGKRSVTVVDLTSPKVNPTIGPGLATHRVEFIDVATADGTRVPFPRLDGVRLTREQTNDLTLVAPVLPGAPVPVVVGPAGPASNLAIGTVTTGAPGSLAAASVTGVAPNQSLNLTLPAGEDGDVTPAAVAARDDARSARDGAVAAAATATDKASAASTSASNAATSQGTASTASAAAVTARGDAVQAATTATGAASAASGSATAAGGSATAAAGSATTAGQAATQASTSATQASNSATSSANSATAAAQSAQDAQSAAGGGVTSVNGVAGPGPITVTAAQIGARPAGDVPWGEVSGKPATYPPSAHNHDGTYATPADVTTASTADRARANHTGLQTASTIADLTEAVQDIVGAFFTNGVQTTVVYDDAANTLKVNATGADAEAMRDTIGAALVGLGLVTVTVNDAADTITISTTATQNQSDAFLLARGNHTGSQPLSTISDAGSAASKTAGSAAGNVPILNGNARLDVARLGSGTADSTTVLYGDGSFKAAPSGGGGIALLARVVRTVDSSYSTTGTSPVDVDATNLALTFTPTGTTARVRLEGFAGPSSGTQYWCLRQGTTNIPGTMRRVSQAAGQGYRSTTMLLTGLTAGTPVTVKWGFAASGTCAITTGIGGGGGGEFDANQQPTGPAIMEVYSA